MCGIQVCSPKHAFAGSTLFQPSPVLYLYPSNTYICGAPCSQILCSSGACCMVKACYTMDCLNILQARTHKWWNALFLINSLSLAPACVCCGLDFCATTAGLHILFCVTVLHQLTTSLFFSFFSCVFLNCFSQFISLSFSLFS